MVSIAAVTMTYNEPEYLPVWMRYYSTQLGASNLFIIDHGSDDGSTSDSCGANIIRIPRSAKDNQRRTDAVSTLCRFLLQWYDVVIHTDCDELAVADPAYYSSLHDYCSTMSGDVITAIGLDVYHTQAEHHAVDLTMPILQQRRYVRFSSSMCKPVVIRKPVTWAAGFHSCEEKVHFDRLFLFHLRYFDNDIGLKRLFRTRSMAWASPEAGAHQRLPDEQYKVMVERAARLPQNDNVTFDQSDSVLLEYCRRVLATEVDAQPPRYRIDLHIFGHEQWRIPDRFLNCF